MRKLNRSAKLRVVALEHRMWLFPGAEKNFGLLVKAGCDPLLLFFLLTHQNIRGSGWINLQRLIADRPKNVRAVAQQLAKTAHVLETTVVKSLIPTLMDVRMDGLVQMMRTLSVALEHVARSSELRKIRRALSYRRLGKVLPIALVCHYVKTQTGEPHYKELAELWSAAANKTVAEDALRHRATRAISRLVLKQQPLLLDTFLNVLNQVAQTSGRE